MSVTVIERIKKLSGYDVRLGFTSLTEEDLKKGSREDTRASFSVDLVDGVEFVMASRRYSVTDRNLEEFGVMKNILEAEGINTANLDHIRLQKHYIFSESGRGFSFKVPATGYLYKPRAGP